MRDPNFINPMRWPRATLLPFADAQTMRRASTPTICRTTIVSPPLMIQISFNSFSCRLFAIGREEAAGTI